ncbi:MAG: NAD(+)/NADH kinase, partial [Acidimicrobiia bacterium]|nr:NAD(+)/NADH kinase [Acidimicrobiia bacterium]
MKIGVVTRPNSDAAAAAVELFTGLAAQRGMLVGSVEERGSGVALEPDRMADCDVVIAIGGDGTVLEAVRYGVPNDLPVLGVNVGRVGF